MLPVVARWWTQVGLLRDTRSIIVSLYIMLPVVARWWTHVGLLRDTTKSIHLDWIQWPKKIKCSGTTIRSCHNCQHFIHALLNSTNRPQMYSLEHCILCFSCLSTISKNEKGHMQWRGWQYDKPPHYYHYFTNSSISTVTLTRCTDNLICTRPRS